MAFHGKIFVADRTREYGTQHRRPGVSLVQGMDGCRAHKH
jgi:hypothetical protein